MQNALRFRLPRWLEIFAGIVAALVSWVVVDRWPWTVVLVLAVALPVVALSVREKRRVTTEEREAQRQRELARRMRPSDASGN